ncbi:MAG: hypothetical protein WA030_02190 [Candidatus Microsaccharimonas sp.]
MDNTSGSKLSSSVSYQPAGMFSKNIPATLRWSNEGKIEVYARDETNSVEGRQLLRSVSVADIRRVRTSYFQYLTIKSHDGNISVSMPGSNRNDYLMGAAIIPLILTKEELDRWNHQPLAQWRNAFKQANIPTSSIMIRFWTLKEFLLFLLVGFAGGIILIIIAFVIFTVLNSFSA